MVLRKIIIDNSVRYIPQKEQRKKLNKTRQQIKNKVNKFNLFQQEDLQYSNE